MIRTLIYYAAMRTVAPRYQPMLDVFPPWPEPDESET